MDSVTAEVVTAWRAVGIDAVLFKGPTVALWLYPTGRVRSYGDSDLFVAPTHLQQALAVLGDLGFSAEREQLARHAITLVRQRDGAVVDLHKHLWSSVETAAHQWDVLRRHTELMQVGGAEVRVPQQHARALFIAAHAAQHSQEREKPAEDLHRALAVTSEETWVRAADLAFDLGVLKPLADGLCVDPNGRALAQRLPLTAAQLSGGREAAIIARLATIHGARARFAVLRRTAVPSTDQMRLSFPLARRGRGGLIAAHVVRSVSMSLRLAGGLRDWRRSRRRQPG